MGRKNSKNINVKTNLVQKELDNLNLANGAINNRIVYTMAVIEYDMKTLKNEYDSLKKYCESFSRFNLNVPDYSFLTMDKKRKQELLTSQDEIKQLIKLVNDASTEVKKFNKNDYDKPKKFTQKRKDKLVNAIIAGKYGNGDARKKKLKKLGYTDKQIESIQKAVNKKLNKTTKNVPTSSNTSTRKNIVSTVPAASTGTNKNTNAKGVKKVENSINSTKKITNTKKKKNEPKASLKNISKSSSSTAAKKANDIANNLKKEQVAREKKYNDELANKEKQIQTEKANSQKAQEEIKNFYEQKITETNNKVDELTNKINTLEQDKTNLTNENNNLQQEINKSNENQFTQSSNTNTSGNSSWTKQANTVQSTNEVENTVSDDQPSSSISDNSSTNNTTVSDTTTSTVDDIDTTTDVDDTENTVVIEPDSDTSNSSSTSKGGSSPIPAILGVTAAGAATVAGVRYIKNKNKSSEYDNDDDDGAFEDDFDNNNDDSGSDDTTYAYQAPQKEVSSEKYRAGSINKLVLDDSSDINISDSYDDDNEDEELE